MSWSIPIGTVRGTVIRLHLTFLLFLLWIAVAHYSAGGPQAALEGVLFISLLFLCVLLHEFGHIIAARRYGVQTPDVILLPIGGVARLERIPEEPAQELVVALAGPAVNVVIAALLYLALGGFVPAGGLEIDNPGVGLLERLLPANLFLVVFNLIPAFPMDGGRVLRAFLAYRFGYARGTQIAATVGQALAFAFGLLGPCRRQPDAGLHRPLRLPRRHLRGARRPDARRLARHDRRRRHGHPLRGADPGQPRRRRGRMPAAHHPARVPGRGRWRPAAGPPHA